MIVKKEDSGREYQSLQYLSFIYHHSRIKDKLLSMGYGYVYDDFPGPHSRGMRDRLWMIGYEHFPHRGFLGEMKRTVAFREPADNKACSFAQTRSTAYLFSELPSLSRQLEPIIKDYTLECEHWNRYMMNYQLSENIYC